MLERFLCSFVLIVVCCGCASLPEATKDKHNIATMMTAERAEKEKVDFSPIYRSTETDKYYDAIEIYNSSPKASQGLYHYDGLVFVIICIDTNKEDIEYLEGTAMLRTAKLLRQHYPGLPSKVHIRNRVVEKYHDYDTGIYRYATAYRKKDIQRKLK